MAPSLLSLRLRGGAPDLIHHLSPDLMNATRISDKQLVRVTRAVIRDLASQNQTSVDHERLQSFRAGRMVVDGATLRPIPDKGLLLFEASEDDGMIHMLWMERSSFSADQAAPLDLILVPGDTTIERVEHWGGRAISDARVYALEYSSSGERFLFWMQEPTLEADDVLFNRVRHVLSPLTYNASAPDLGWRWESHMNLSLSLGLQNRLRDAEGRAHHPGLPVDPAHPVYLSATANASARHRARWVAEAERQAAAARAAVTVSAPALVPAGGQHWRYWEPKGATRVTHWDPITIRCATEGATIYYKWYESYDEVWEDDDADTRPYTVKWRKYERPLMLQRPGLYEELGHEGIRVKAVAIKEGCADSPIVTGDYAVFIHAQDRPSLRCHDAYFEHDDYFNVSHPATVHLDVKMRRAARAWQRFVDRRLAQHASGEINETTDEVYPLEQPDEALGMDPWPPAAPDSDDPDARPGPALPPGAVCRDAVTGVALDELGFPLDSDGPGGPMGLGGPGGPLSMLRSLPRPGGRRPGGR